MKGDGQMTRFLTLSTCVALGVGFLALPGLRAQERDDHIVIVGQLTSSVKFVERMEGRAEAALTRLGNRVIFTNMRFTRMEVQSPYGKLKSTQEIMGTVNAEAIVTGVRQTPNGRVGGAHFTRTDVDFGSDGKIDLTLDKAKGNGPSRLFFDLHGRRGRITRVRSATVPTDGAVPVKGLNIFEGYSGTIFFSGWINAERTDVIVTCLLQRQR